MVYVGTRIEMLVLDLHFSYFFLIWNSSNHFKITIILLFDTDNKQEFKVIEKDGASVRRKVNAEPQCPSLYPCCFSPSGRFLSGVVAIGDNLAMVPRLLAESAPR